MIAHYLALGDSYTIGEGIAPEDRWPVRLADALRGEGVAIDAPRIVATTGWTTDELDAAIDAAALRPPFDLVSLLIGVNDQYRGRDVATYAPAFEALLARAIGFAGGDATRVFVLAIPDWGVTPFGAHSGRDTAAIARELGAAPQSLTMARQALLKRELVYSPKHGYLNFTIPHMGHHLLGRGLRDSGWD
mgnify:CR=1 FL=1